MDKKDSSSLDFRILHKELRTIPVDSWNYLAATGYDKFIEETPELLGIDKDLLRLMGRMAHDLNEDQFHEAVSNNTIPPLKLSRKELALLKGGELAKIGKQLQKIPAGFANRVSKIR